MCFNSFMFMGYVKKIVLCVYPVQVLTFSVLLLDFSSVLATISVLLVRKVISVTNCWITLEIRLNICMDFSSLIYLNLVNFN